MKSLACAASRALAGLGLAVGVVAAPSVFAQAAPKASQTLASPAATPVPRLPPIDPIARPVRKGEFPLYPGKTVKGPDEQWESYLGGPIVRNVINPTLTPMLPEPGKSNGTAVIFAPGGGFLYLGMNDAEPAKLVQQGVTVFILKYRTNPTDRDPPTFLSNMYRWLFDMAAKSKQPGADAAAPLHAAPEALEDGLAAMRLVRSRAKEWGIDPKRIGFMGGSAGAMTAIDVGYTRDDLARPDFLVSMIGPKKVEPVPATAPPLFVAASLDDPLFPGSTENVVSAWGKSNRPVESHYYEKGGHALAKGTTGDRWFENLLAWMTQHGWIGTTK